MPPHGAAAASLVWRNLNLKCYGEFDAHDRPSGYNAWLTLSISPAAPNPPPSAMLRPTMFTK